MSVPLSRPPDGLAAPGPPPGPQTEPVAPPPSARRPVAAPAAPEWLASALERWPIRPVRLLGGVAVAVVLAGVALWLLRSPPAPIERTLPRASPASVDGVGAAPVTTSAQPSTSTPTAVVVHAAGAVQHPGVYRLRAGARVDDLVTAAGGLAVGADGNRLNLAAPLADGERVYVPKVGEDAVPEPPTQTGGAPTSAGPGGGGGSGNGGTTGPLDLNAASADQLDTLPGVGPATAQAILDYRQQHGRFRSVDELLEVRGIGDAKLAELRSKVRV